MLVEQRTYELKPGTLHAFLAAYEAEGLALQSAAWGGLLGYFTCEIGDLNRVIHLWGFPSYEERTKRRAALAADPRWKNFITAAGAHVVSQKSELLTPAPFSPIGGMK